MNILSIETSCDDTSVAIVKAKGGFGRPAFDILSNIVSSQVKIHAPYGGVVPYLAARAHQKNSPICLEEAIKQAKNIKINLITVTVGPGLEPSLWAGVNFAKSLSLVSRIPILGTNHIEGHIYANWLSVNKRLRVTSYKLQVKFPILCLVVSGGHTQLILVKDYLKYKLIGETRDDAAGEAFDKVAKLLELGYPGGPIISKMAKKGNSRAYGFPRPMINSKDYDFSFSGLKTAVLYETKKNSPEKLKTQKIKSDISASFQKAVVDVLISKTLRVAKEYGAKTIMLAGGVAANQELRKQVVEVFEKQYPESIIQYPTPNFCTDNAAMIAAAGYFRHLKYGPDKLKNIKADANLRVV